MSRFYSDERKSPHAWKGSGGSLVVAERGPKPLMLSVRPSGAQIAVQTIGARQGQGGQLGRPSPQAVPSSQSPGVRAMGLFH